MDFELRMGGTDALQQLQQVVLEVDDVIVHQKLQSEAVTFAQLACIAQGFRRNLVNEPRQMQIVGTPQSYQRHPVGVLITLDAHPSFLLIFRQAQVIGKLQTYKALVVVRGRIDQVAQHFLF